MSVAYAGNITVRQYTNKVTSLLSDEAVLQIVNVTLCDLRYVVFARAYYTMGLAVEMHDCLFCDQREQNVIYQNQYINA